MVFPAEFTIQQAVGCFRYIDLAGCPFRLHPGGNVDCIAPNVVSKFFGADHPGYYRPGMDANSCFKGRQVLFAALDGRFV